MSILDELGAWLTSPPQSQGTLDSDVFLGSMPDDPIVSAATVTALYATPGSSPQEVFGSDAYLRERVQVVVRSRLYPTAMTKAEAIRDLLHGVSNETVGGRFYARISALQSAPFQLGGPDDQGRFRIACNYDCWRAPS